MNFRRNSSKSVVLLFSFISIITLMLVISTITISIQQLLPTKAYAQIGSMATLQNIDATYAVSIVPGAAQRDSPYHYFPPAINLPIGTTVAWFNNDFGQPHTVTSGAPNSSDSGSIFHSGIMPATANSFFQYTFDKSGNYVYHCMIHPWRSAIITVGNSYESGHNFQMSSGVGSILNLTKDFRTLLSFKPLTIPLDGITPLTYNISIIKNANDTVFSKSFVTSGESLPLELIVGNNNETISYGPDFSSTGSYHIEGQFFNDNANYTIRAELMAIDSKQPEDPIIDDFAFRTVK
jgi:plastocyanin